MRDIRRGLWLIAAGIVMLVCGQFAYGQSSKEEQKLEKTVQSSVARNVYIEVGESHTCSGVIYATNLVITNKHCNTPPLYVNGFPATVVRVGDKEDLLLLRTQTMRFQRLEFDLNPSPIEQVYQVSNPLDRRNYVDFGRVTYLTPGSMSVSIKGAPGSSGGGIYSYEGRLVGIVTGALLFKHSEDEKEPVAALCGEAIPATKVKTFVEGFTFVSR